MPRLPSLLLSSMGLLHAAMPAMAQEPQQRLHVSATLASDFIYNGLSQTESESSLRFSVDYEHVKGFFAGGHIGNVEYASEYRVQKPRDIQLNVYAGYHWQGDDWSASVATARYLYPGTTYDYDYFLTSINASYRDRYFMSVSRSNDYLALGSAAYVLELGLARPWLWGLEFGVNAGRYSPGNASRARYSFWDAGLSKVFGNFSMDLRYHANTYDRVSLLGDPGGDAWVLSVAHAIIPRRHVRSP